MKSRPTEEAYEFRAALANDLSKASIMLQKQPRLLDQPVYGSSESALHFYSAENQIDIVKWLLDHGANPNGVSDGDSPLHSAAQLGHLSVCQALLKAGAKPNLINNLEETALHKASTNGYIDIIQTLLNSVADPNIKEMCGELPIDQALPRKLEQIRSVFKNHAQNNKND